MSEVSISFERDLESKQVTANLNIGDDFERVPESDIRVKWARLALRYARQIAEVKTLEFNPHIVDTGAVLSFTGFNDCDPEDEDYDFDDFMDDDEDGADVFFRVTIERMTTEAPEQASEEGYAIGFNLDTGDAYQRIGGLATPSVQLAGLIHQLLLRARSRAA